MKRKIIIEKQLIDHEIISQTSGEAQVTPIKNINYDNAYKYLHYKNITYKNNISLTLSIQILIETHTPKVFLALVAEKSDKNSLSETVPLNFPPEDNLEDGENDPPNSLSEGKKLESDAPNVIFQNAVEQDDETVQQVNLEIKNQLADIVRIRKLKEQLMEESLDDKDREQILQELSQIPNNLVKFEENHLTHFMMIESRLNDTAEIEPLIPEDTPLNSPDITENIHIGEWVTLDVLATSLKNNEFIAKILTTPSLHEKITLKLTINNSDFHAHIFYALKNKIPFSVTIINNESFTHAKPSDVLQPRSFDFSFTEDDVLSTVKGILATTKQEGFEI
ncbi:MAG: hypothetical protein IBX55_19150 [Methyloprofundus sp.]|nr:hypothetical protein [Methyloprofundus sp.]